MRGQAAIGGLALALALGMGGGAGAARAETADPAFGLWLTENGGGIVEIGPCGAGACGRMVWLRRPAEEGGAPRLDALNPDPARRGQPLCGLALLEGFTAEAPGRWAGGRIYNPRDGRAYSAEFALEAPDRLSLRGYVGLPVFGSSQVWTRVPDNRGGC